MVYIDLNMVRAGSVLHPEDWRWCGYHDIQTPSPRYAVIDRTELLELFGVNTYKQFQQIHKEWIETELKSEQTKREALWSQSLAVGHKHFVESVQSTLCINGRYRKVIEEEDRYTLKEPSTPYVVHLRHKKGVLSSENAIMWE